MLIAPDGWNRKQGITLGKGTDMIGFFREEIIEFRDISRQNAVAAASSWATDFTGHGDLWIHCIDEALIGSDWVATVCYSAPKPPPVN
jgi:hypothetical protein